MLASEFQTEWWSPLILVWSLDQFALSLVYLTNGILIALAFLLLYRDIFSLVFFDWVMFVFIGLVGFSWFVFCYCLFNYNIDILSLSSISSLSVRVRSLLNIIFTTILFWTSFKFLFQTFYFKVKVNIIRNTESPK